MTDDIAYAELTQVAELIRTRQVTSAEVTDVLLARIDALDPALHSFVHVTPDAARAAAALADAELASGRRRGPLHGVPVAVKDLLHTADAPTAAGTTVLDGPPDFDATAVARLRAAGAVVLGKLRMTEGAFLEYHPGAPVPVNPWDAGTWAGVSSSGCGVATAAGLCYGSLGSDTGGSIRMPSAMNGLTGLKPTWGRVSRYGVVELAGSLDHIGPMARSAADCAALLGAIAGADLQDATASPEPVPDYLGSLGRLAAPPRVGVDRTLLAQFDAPTRTMLDAVEETLLGLGWGVMDVTTPDLGAAAMDFAPLCAVEAARAHAATFPTRADEYGPGFRALLESGRAMSGESVEALRERRADFSGRLRRLFSAVDLLLLPGIGVASPSVAALDGLMSDFGLLAGLIVPTAPFDLSGSPTITFPAGFTDRGTPLGAQLVGAHFSEGLLLQAAHAFQSVTGFHRVHPEVGVDAGVAR